LPSSQAAFGPESRSASGSSGEAFDTFDRTIDSHVKNLRAKLGARPDGGSYVETIRGVGYRAARPVDQA